MTGKRVTKSREGIDRKKLYALNEAVSMVKSRASAKSDETMEVALNLGVDPRHELLEREVTDAGAGVDEDATVEQERRGSAACGNRSRTTENADLHGEMGGDGCQQRRRGANADAAGTLAQATKSTIVAALHGSGPAA